MVYFSVIMPFVGNALFKYAAASLNMTRKRYLCKTISSLTVREEGRFGPLVPDREIIAAIWVYFYFFSAKFHSRLGKNMTFNDFPSYHQGKLTNVFPVSVIIKNQYVAPVTFCCKSV